MNHPCLVHAACPTRYCELQCSSGFTLRTPIMICVIITMIRCSVHRIVAATTSMPLAMLAAIFVSKIWASYLLSNHTTPYLTGQSKCTMLQSAWIVSPPSPFSSFEFQVSSFLLNDPVTDGKIIKFHTQY
jgi:hypothetical protein